MEAEVRDILRLALQHQVPDTGLGTWIHHRFAEIGGAELDLPERSEQPRYVHFDK
jgi:plasmid stability protein